MPTYEYKCNNCGIIEIFHSIKDEAWTICPHCSGEISRLISPGGGIIIGHREANQFADIQMAKYWRDKNGVRHKVTPADGTSKSPTVSKQTVSDEEVQRRTKKSRERIRKQESKESYRRYVKNVFKNKAQ
jgi:putative FmdB family regulatory protein